MPVTLPKSESKVLRSHASSERVLRGCSIVLSAVILALGLYAAVSTVLLVYRTHSPVPYFDQWAIVDSMMHSGKIPTLSMLWAQHNEHRIPIGRITGYADFEWFGGRNISLLIEVYLIQVAIALVFIWMFHRFGPPRRVVLVTAAGFFIYCMLCPVQLGNFIWGFQTTFVFTGLAAAVAFAAFVWHADKIAMDKKRWMSAPLLLSLCAAFLAECGIANGLFVWPILVLLGFLLDFPKRSQVLTGMVGLVAVALYLNGYHSPPQHANPLVSIQHPLAVTKFVITYFASTWDPSLPSSSSWPTVSESMTALALTGALSIFVWFFSQRPGKRDLLRTFLLSNMLFAMVAAALTSLGRLNFGLEIAVSNHYQAIALVFWASLGGFLLTWLDDLSRSFALLELQIGLVILMLATAGRFSALEQASKQHQMDLARAFAELAFNPADHEAIKILYPDPAALNGWYAYLRSHNLGPDPHEFIVSPPSHPVKILDNPIPNWAGYHIISSGKCLGFLDAVRPVQQGSDKVVAGGWAWDLAAAKPPAKIVLALSDGLVVGFAEVDGIRPDVKSVKKEVTELKTGWGTVAVVPHGSVVRAFAVLADATSICPLSNEIAVP
jgi:hypothetical protein